MSYGDLKSDARAVAEPKHVRLFNLQLSKERGNVVRGRLKGDGPLAIACTAVPLLLDSNDPAGCGKVREHAAERDLNGRPASVKQDEWNAVSATVHFVIHFYAVNRRMTALKRL